MTDRVGRHMRVLDPSADWSGSAAQGINNALGRYLVLGCTPRLESGGL